MKKIILLITAITVFFSFQLTAQWVDITDNNPTKLEKQLISSDINSSVINFKLDGFYKNKVQTPQGEQYVISLDGATPILEEGNPDLPKATASVIIPDLEKMKVKVTDFKYRDFQGIDIAPSKGNLLRTVNPSDVPYTYGKVYKKNAFFPENNVDLRTPHIIRDYRGQTIVVYPFQYNPITKTLRVYYDITVELNSTGLVGENPFYRKKAINKIDNNFAQIYNKRYLNANNAKYEVIEEEGDILIIAYSEFMDAMQPYIEWKKMTGRKVEMVSVEDAGGNSSGIEDYIADYYNDSENNLAFCLLVGDDAQVPSAYSNGDSDVKYSFIVGNDHYPDIIIGRFSAETEAHVETQVQRTLDYEKNPYIEEDWYPNSISIGSNQGEGTGDDGEGDWQHLRNIQLDLNEFTYEYNYEFFEGTQGDNDSPGNPTPSNVADALNSGSSIINYTGHGSDFSFVTSGFSNSNVNTLQNAGKLPFIWSVACVNGNFVGQTCFAEAWLRATDNDDNPTGAIATLMSTINQPWVPPMIGQDEMNDILTEHYDDNIKRTFGALSFNGMMLMIDELGSSAYATIDTWTIFGDPSVLVRTAMPTNIEASYQPAIFIGATDYSVSGNGIDGATVAITLDGELLGKGIIENGTATINFTNPPMTPGDAKLVITQFNKIPLIADVEVIPAEGPYVTLQENEINDENGNGLAEFNENVNLSIILKNVGVETAINVNSVLSTEDDYVTITDAQEDVGNINADALITLEDAFSFTVGNDVPDGHIATFKLTSTSGDDEWESNFSIVLNAPIFTSGILNFQETTGNNSNSLDPGETGVISIPCYNTGHADATDGTVQLTTESSYITIENNDYDFSSIVVDNHIMTEFNITCDNNTPMGHVANMMLTITSGEYTYTKEYMIKVGVIMEDWESNSFDSHPWEFEGNAEWQIVSDETYEGMYSAKSGSIQDNQNSILLLNRSTPNADTISFFYKVSSENNYDKLNFYVDGTLQDSWSGNVGWTLASYPISAGDHNFKWEYFKDASQASGSDCAWIDNIVLPASPTKSINAGLDVSVCGNEPTDLNGSATLIDDILWTTSGDGSFDNPNNLQATYNPGSEDVLTGNVTLTLTEIGGDMSDNLMITYDQNPEGNAGDDMEICEDEVLTIEGASASNYSQITWSTVGSGEFNDVHALMATYTPSDEDIAQGSIVLTLTVESEGACPDVMDEMILSFNQLPEMPAIPEGETEICAGSNVEYMISTAANAQEYMWIVEPEDAGSITGEGNIINVNWSTVYAGDAMIKVKSINDCGESDFSPALEVIINSLPTAEFISDIAFVDVHTTESTLFNISDASNYNSIEWSIEPNDAVNEVQNADTEEVTFVWNNQFANNSEANVICTLTNDCGVFVLEHPIVIKNTDGLNELVGVSNINVYPNPSNGTFSVKLNGEKEQQISIKVIDMTGKVIFQEHNLSINGDFSKEINIKDASGLYYLVIDNTDGNYIKKIVIK